MAKNATRGDSINRGSGNVLADIGFEDAEERQTKLRLAYVINQILEDRGGTQSQAATLLELNQPKISALQNYRLDGFSVERLMTLLTILDRDVDIVVKKKPRGRASGRIVVVLSE